MWHQKPKVQIGYDDKLNDLGQIPKLTYGLRPLLMFNVSQFIVSDNKSPLPLWHTKSLTQKRKDYFPKRALSVKLYDFGWSISSHHKGF